MSAKNDLSNGVVVFYVQVVEKIQEVPVESEASKLQLQYSQEQITSLTQQLTAVRDKYETTLAEIRLSHRCIFLTRSLTPHSLLSPLFLHLSLFSVHCFLSYLLPIPYL